jgi:hypothetical protein
MNGETGPKAGSQVLAAERDQLQVSSWVCNGDEFRWRDAQARQRALNLALSACAVGIFDPNRRMLDSLAGLSASALFDLEVAAA